MERALVSLFVITLFVASFVAGHFIWPGPANAKADKRHSRYACPTPTNDAVRTADGEPIDPAHPEGGVRPAPTLDAIKTACKNAIEHPDDRELLNKIYTTTEDLGDGMHEPLLVFLSGLPMNLTTNHQIQEIVIVRWTELDPAAAARFALKIQPAGFQRDMLQRLLSTWADHDAASAKAFLATIPDEQLRSFLTQNILQELTRENPQGALKLALGLPPGMVSNALGQVFSAWASDDAREALDAAGKLAPGATKQSVLGSVLADWAREEPEAAMNWLTSEDRGLGPYLFQVFVTVA
ncbi:MAG: hypothetical protein H7Z43_03910, partial [Clostridia bacterium]|nr:hypothetical protein [Deltaproteobacteria bacterium]